MLFLGPKILSFNDTKTDVEFALRAVPLGGYVAFPQNLIFNDQGMNLYHIVLFNSFSLPCSYPLIR